MRLTRAHVKNFRCIADQTLDVDGVTALVGRNGAGKSTFLHALRVFYENAAGSLSADDFHGRTVAHPIDITLTWEDLTDAARDRFESYLQGDTLSVTYRVTHAASGRPKGTYHGHGLRHEPFQGIRSETGKVAQKALYNAFRMASDYADLPAARTADAAVEALSAWEAAHPDRCERQSDDGQFFGFANVGAGSLAAFTGFTYVPAARDAATDDDTGRTSTLSLLVDQLVRSAIREDDASRVAMEEIKRLANQIYGGETHPKLTAVRDRIASRLQNIVPTADLELKWAEDPTSKLDPPRAAARLTEDRFDTSIAGAGHGLQRAYVIALIQEWASTQRTAVGGEERSFILAMEEPELYQHPNRQRHLADILYGLAAAGTGCHVQVVYTTHSPLFTRIERFDGVRRLSKDTDCTPPCTKVVSAKLDDVARTLATAYRKDPDTHSGESLQTRLSDVMRPFVNEGFFADFVVLVEGASDRAALLGAAAHADVSLAAHGISVLPCGGKRNVVSCTAIFRALHIPCYAVWDADDGEGDAHAQATAAEINAAMYVLHGLAPAGAPGAVYDECACYNKTMEHTLVDEMGDRYTEIRLEVAVEMGYDRPREGRKNPRVVRETLVRLSREGLESPTLSAILSKILIAAGVEPRPPVDAGVGPPDDTVPPDAIPPAAGTGTAPQLAPAGDP